MENIQSRFKVYMSKETYRTQAVLVVDDTKIFNVSFKRYDKFGLLLSRASSWLSRDVIADTYWDMPNTHGIDHDERARQIAKTYTVEEYVSFARKAAKIMGCKVGDKLEVNLFADEVCVKDEDNDSVISLGSESGMSLSFRQVSCGTYKENRYRNGYDFEPYPFDQLFFADEGPSWLLSADVIRRLITPTIELIDKWGAYCTDFVVRIENGKLVAKEEPK